MKEGRPSVTASFVAFARAAASCRPLTNPPLHDPIARGLFPWPKGYVGQTLSRAVSIGLVDHIALRSAAIDDALAAGFPQVVLVGAGLDARAYRLPLERVFELDHPASQSRKLRRIRDLVPRSRSVKHVAADFIKDDVGGLLAAVGHDVALPTAWVMEGLTLYLERSVTEHLLAIVSARSAKGSLAAITYMRPPKHRLPPPSQLIGDFMLRHIGEPLLAAFTPDQIADCLRAASFTPQSDTCAVDWAKRFGASAALARAFRAERLVIATR